MMENNVDMLAMARDVNVHDKTHTQNDFIKVIAPAKVNLVLDVGDMREDGYHEVNTIMHTLMLHDVVYVRRIPWENKTYGPETPEGNLCANSKNGNTLDNGKRSSACTSDDGNACASITSKDAHDKNDNPRTQFLQVKTRMVGRDGVIVPQVPNENNLVTKAAYALASECRHEPNDKNTKSQTTPECIEILVEKHIPAQAGLGGGSADAAAALVGLAKLWGVSDNDSVLESTAKKLGSDVAFFLQGGCAEYTNRGDEFVRTLTPTKQNVLLVKPDAGLSTAEVYRTFDDICSRTKHEDDPQSPHHAPRSQSTQQPPRSHAQQTKLAQHAQMQHAHKNACDLTPFNNLTPAAEHLLPTLKDLRTWLEAQPEVSNVILCGSGSCLCAMCNSFESAMRLSSAPRLQNCWTRTTSLANLKATLLPN